MQQQDLQIKNKKYSFLSGFLWLISPNEQQSLHTNVIWNNIKQYTAFQQYQQKKSPLIATKTTSQFKYLLGGGYVFDKDLLFLCCQLTWIDKDG